MHQQRFLVTGAAGSVGRALCRTLLARGYAVRAVIRSRESAGRLPSGVEIGWTGEIGPTTAWPRELFDGVDCVVHLAAKVHCRRSTDAAEFMAMNADATETLLRAMANAGANRPRRFVYCSSVHAVGTFSAETFDETTICRPQTPYGASKLAAEKIVRSTAEESGLEAVIIRPVPIYGPELPGNLMQLLKLMALGWPLPIGAVHNRRSLVFVDNVADALIAASIHPAAAGETFFVSDGCDVSLSELATLFATATGRNSRTISIAPERLRWMMRAVGKGDAAERLLGSLVVDSTKLRRMLAWTPRNELAGGLLATAQWLRRAA